MMNVTEKINYLKGVKEDIRQAIEEKGVDVPVNTPLKDYADRISEIEGGGGGEGMNPKDCADLNLYLSGAWYGDMVDGIGLTASFVIPAYKYVGRPFTSYTVVDDVPVVSIGNYAFYNCINLESVSKVTGTIGSYAFAVDSTISGKLKTISAPKTTTIGTYAFQYQAELEEVEFPSVTTLNNNSFSRCTSLKKVVLPKLAGNFGGTSNSSSNYFAYSPNIKVIDLGDAVTAVRYFTYYNSSYPEYGRVENLIIRRTTPPSLYNYACMNPVTNIYVPDDAVDTYKGTTNWSNDNVVGKIKPLSEYVEVID